jgi:hypothetical protein
VVGREHAVIASEMRPRWRTQGREPTQKLDRRERELGATVSQGTLEGHHHPSGWIAREPRVGDRRAGAVAAQPLEAVAILGLDETIGVERVAIEECGPVAGPG